MLPKYQHLRDVLDKAGAEDAATAAWTKRTTLVGSALVIFLAFGTIGVLFQRTRAKSRALAEQNARLLELDRMKDSFVAAVSHELRTPLTSILGYAELLGDGEGGELTPDQSGFVRVIDRNANRLLRLVSDLLFVAQVDAGKVTLDQRIVDLPTVCADSIEAARPFAEEKGVELRLRNEGSTHLSADQARLAQVVDNLVSNAIKFAPAGGTVEVRCARGPSATAVLEVSDSGIGIPAAAMGRLFDRFYRTQGAQQRAIPGTGLGLSIVKAIVEAHGGSIEVESVEGAGTTFRVTLPSAQAALADSFEEQARAA